ncbi:cytosine deaminase [Metschnikowia bicuspidata var. bicuspidata NRRL YB-4993]|uniref:Cytosine deaminase n=1 Tax=Metschnikowia bicuspidata var. bicuspidata NRRL YB-4993 TaxID=869754 RepID=A0A1A0HAV5_9ASCO|nr:cytosine deaminase [Metschnikowia bicuspidata var. bicuspidata NRRL YB-4993]OBA21254.1 cytosine deaminase [Metschnikowia bicuspidata var. bicuspidata NRRL YB-4993]
MPFDDKLGMQIALEEARKSLAEGGIPIGGALIHEDGRVLGRGHNMRIQKNSATLHGEISTLENAGRLPGALYKDCTMYTTLSPCHMCSGACIMYGVKRVVLGENVNFVGAEELVKSKGIEVVNLDDPECKKIMSDFIKARPEDWFEDIGK